MGVGGRRLIKPTKPTKTTPRIKVFKAYDEAIIPSKSRYSDAEYELTIIKEHKRLTSNTVIYDTGIKLEIPNAYYVEIVPRSSISRSGYILANNVGITTINKMDY